MFLLVSSCFKEFYCTYLTIYSKEILPFLQLHRLFQSCVCASGIWTLDRYGDEDDRLDEMDLSGIVFSLGRFYHCDYCPFIFHFLTMREDDVLTWHSYMR